MTIINIPNDGLCPELIVIFRIVANLGVAEQGAIIDACSKGSNKEDKESLTRLRGALSNWIKLGLFSTDNDAVKINDRFRKIRGEVLDDYTARLPSFCRTLLFEERNCLPLSGESPGLAADFVRGIAWLLLQDIYGFPTAWDDVNTIQSAQISGISMLGNDIRWNGLRLWSRYLGFATGESSSFQIDPTIAVRSILPSIFESRIEISAHEFLEEVAIRLPVLDFGRYRAEVEGVLNSQVWRKPADGHLSSSLSFALRRLALDNIIYLEGKADAGSSYRLTGKNYRTWVGFESVRWNGAKT
jgi:hypothetical protein